MAHTTTSLQNTVEAEHPGFYYPNFHKFPHYPLTFRIAMRDRFAFSLSFCVRTRRSCRCGLEIEFSDTYRVPVCKKHAHLCSIYYTGMKKVRSCRLRTEAACNQRVLKGSRNRRFFPKSDSLGNAGHQNNGQTSAAMSMAIRMNPQTIEIGLVSRHSISSRSESLPDSRAKRRLSG